MSTNAVIRVEGLDSVELYKHYDGYPEGTLEWLQEFNEDFEKNQGDDPQYKFAQLVRDSVVNGVKFSLDPSKYTGWGVDKPDSFYYDFLYILKNDGTVEVHR
jgi:hypothetical protein